MKVIVFGLLAIATVAQSSVIPFQTVKTIVPVAQSTTLVRTPTFDSAIINSERLDGAFSYNTVENHAYTPVVYQSVPTWNVIPQYPVVYGHPSYPAVHPLYNFVPSYSPVNPTQLPQPGQPPIEVEDPADNASNDLKQEQSNDNDDDTVAVESA